MRKVRISTSPDKIRIPTLRRTIPDYCTDSHFAQNIYINHFYTFSLLNFYVHTVDLKIYFSAYTILNVRQYALKI